jgi:ornithine carbamoyltransferase
MKKIALIFEKTSTRTRCAFEAAAYDQGACVTYLDPSGSQLGAKESVKDTARVLGRMYDGIQYRGFAQEPSRPWRSTPGCRSGTASPTNFTRRRCWPTC